MKRASITISILCSLLVFCVAPALFADERCSARSIAGDWGYTVTGVRNPFGPAASVGLFHLDREGNLTGTQTLSINGTIVQGEVLTGTVTVSSDCSGVTVIDVSNTPFPRTAHIDTVFVGGSTEFQSIFSDSGLVLTVIGKKIHNGGD